jgi:hypothetical protein
MPRPKNFERNEGITKLASEVGLSVATVSKKRRQGKTEEQIRKEAADWHTKETKQAVKEEAGKETFTEAQRRKEVALADLRELELATNRGELANVAEVNAFVSGMIVRCRDLFCRIAPEMRDRLSKETDPIRIGELIEAEITRALTQLSQFKGGAQ